MSKPSPHKTVQSRILAFAQAIGWTLAPRDETELQRGFDPEVPISDRAKYRSLFFDEVLDARVREFMPGYAEAGYMLCGRFRQRKPNSPKSTLFAAISSSAERLGDTYPLDANESWRHRVQRMSNVHFLPADLEQRHSRCYQLGVPVYDIRNQ